MKQANLLIGVGNVLFRDEGVGVYTSQYLEKNYSYDDSLEIMDGGVLGFKLMALFQEYDNVIILDTVSIEDTPGSIFRLPSDVLLGLGSYRKTAHEVEIIEMLEICSMLDKIANVVIIGIVPKDIETVENAMTKEVLDAMPAYISTVLDELTALGVKYEKRNDIKIESIIENFFKENSFGNQI